MSIDATERDIDERRNANRVIQAAKDVLSHHIIRDLAGKSDTLDERLTALRRVVGWESVPIYPCVHCGEADRSKGDHGLGRCVWMSAR